MQKFGVQTEKGKNITCWRNGDKHMAEGVKIVIHPTKFKTYDQLKTEFNTKVELYTGNVNKVYTMDKKLVKGLEDFEDGHNYICCGAEKLNEDIIPRGLIGIFGKQEQASTSTSTSTTEDSSSSDTPTTTTTTTTTPLKPRSMSTSTHTTPVKLEHSSNTTTPLKPRSSSTSAGSSPSVTSPPSAGLKKPVCSVYQSGQKPDKFSTQTEKAKVINAFRNGDKFHGGERVTIHSTKFKTYDQLKEQLSKQVKLVTGSVRKVYSVDGKQVKDLNDFIDGGYYICCGGEVLNTHDINPILVQQQQQQQEQKPQESQQQESQPISI